MSIEEEAVLANLVDDVVVVFVMINFDDWDHFRSQKNRERFLYLRRRLLLLVPNNAKMIFNRKIWRKKEANNGIGRGGGFESRWVCPKIALQSLLVDKTRERERCFKILKKNCKQDERDKQRHRERERRTFIIDVSTNWISSKERRSGEDGGKGGGNFRRRIRVGLAESGGGGSKVPLLTTYWWKILVQKVTVRTKLIWT